MVLYLSIIYILIGYFMKIPSIKYLPQSLTDPVKYPRDLPTDG